MYDIALVHLNSEQFQVSSQCRVCDVQWNKHQCCWTS